MDIKKLGVVELFDKDEVACCDENVVAFLDQGVLACLDKNIKDDFGVDFIHAHHLGYLLEETLGGKYLFRHGYMQKIGRCTYAHFCYHSNYKKRLFTIIT